MKKVLFYSILVFVLVVLVGIFSYKVLKNKTSSDLVLTVSVEKDIFILGEDIDVTYTIENKGKEIDTVINFDEWTLCTNTRISSDKSGSAPYGDEGPMVASSSKINPGEKFSTKSKINFFRGSEGSPRFSYFPIGNYTIRGMCEDKHKHKIESKKIGFKIVSPTGNDLKAFEDFKYFTNYYNELEKRIMTKEDNMILLDKTLEFLYKYPTSPYTGKLLEQSRYNRKYGKYKYDESMLKDIEFYISNNPYSYYNRGLLFDIVSFFQYEKKGKEKTIEYLNKLSGDIKSSKLDSQIQFVIKNNELLR
jgi:hypothetical protein